MVMSEPIWHACHDYPTPGELGHALFHASGQRAQAMAIGRRQSATLGQHARKLAADLKRALTWKGASELVQVVALDALSEGAWDLPGARPGLIDIGVGVVVVGSGLLLVQLSLEPTDRTARRFGTTNLRELSVAEAKQAEVELLPNAVTIRFAAGPALVFFESDQFPGNVAKARELASLLRPETVAESSVP